MAIRACLRCGIMKNVEDCFHRQTKGMGGYFSVCKDCRSIERRAYYVEWSKRESKRRDGPPLKPHLALVEGESKRDRQLRLMREWKLRHRDE